MQLSRTRRLALRLGARHAGIPDMRGAWPREPPLQCSIVGRPVRARGIPIVFAGPEGRLGAGLKPAARAICSCHCAGEASSECLWLPAMFVGHAGPCSMDPCQCSALLAGSRGRAAPPGTHVPPSGAREVGKNEYLSS